MFGISCSIYNWFTGRSVHDDRQYYEEKQNQKWYIIEGNIGSGKTTLINKLKEQQNIEVLEEPVIKWKQIKDEKGENILGLFYQNPQKYAYLFQTIVFKTRMMDIETPQSKPIRFSERSIWTDKNVFSKNCRELGYLNEIEKNVYDTWFYWLENKLERKPNAIFYLKAAPEICMDRIHIRNRQEETNITLDYIKSIHEKHEEWLNDKEYQGIPVYIIDNNGNPENAYQQVMSILKN